MQRRKRIGSTGSEAQRQGLQLRVPSRTLPVSFRCFWAICSSKNSQTRALFACCSLPHSLRVCLQVCATFCCLVTCRQPEPDSYSVQARIYDGYGGPLEGATLYADGHPLGRTDASGILEATLAGREGQAVVLYAECPTGFRNPLDPRPLRLRRFAQPGEHRALPPIQVSWQCLPTRRLAALVVRTAGQEDIPVVIQGKHGPAKAMARTGPQGTAHVLLKLPPGAEFRATLDTSARPELRPRSPTRSFRLEDQDIIFWFEQDFEHKRRPKKRRKRRAKPPKRIPYRIM